MAGRLNSNDAHTGGRLRAHVSLRVARPGAEPNTSLPRIRPIVGSLKAYLSHVLRPLEEKRDRGEL
jgi:hypothetical protein